MTVRTFSLLLSIAGFFVLSSCRKESPLSPSPPQFVYRPAYAWPHESLSQAGIDSVLIAHAIDSLRNNSTTGAFVLIRNDSLVAEYYRFGISSENDYDIRSASKSVISCLVGIAFDKGFLDSLNEAVLNFFPDFDTTGMDPRKRSITIEHLLTMRAGFEYTDGNDYSSVYTQTAIWPLVTLGLPLKFDPGSAFSYATPQTHLLSAILTRATGMSTYEFAEQYLFSKLNISVRFWYQDPQNVYFGGTGMSFTARDLARFGYLYLMHGHTTSESVVSDSWIQKSIIPRNAQNTSWGPFSKLNYGYSWWVNNGAPDTLYYAGGFAGQFIFIVPNRNMVAAFTSDPLVSSAQASANELTILNLFSSKILPAVPLSP